MNSLLELPEDDDFDQNLGMGNLKFEKPFGNDDIRRPSQIAV